MLARLDDEPVAALLAVRGEPPAWLRRTVAEPTARHDRDRKAQHRRAPGTASDPPRLGLPATDADQALGDVRRQPVLRARARDRAPPPWRDARARRAAPHPGDAERAPGRAPRRSRRRRVRRGSGGGCDRRIRRRSSSRLSSPVRPRRVSSRPSRRRSSSSTATASASPTRSSAPPSPRVTDRRAGERSMHGSPNSSRRRRSARGTSRTRRPNPIESIAAILEEAAQVGERARRRARLRRSSSERAFRLTPPRHDDDARRRLSSRPRGRTSPATSTRATAAPRAGARDRFARRRASRRRSRSSPGSPSAPVRQWSSSAPPSRRPRATTGCSPRSTSDSPALMRFTDGAASGLEHGELAVRRRARTGDAALRCRALAAYGLLHFNAGMGIPVAEMDEALAARAIACRLAARRRARRRRSLISSGGRETSTPRGRSSTRYGMRCRRRGDVPGEADALWYLGARRVAGRELGRGRPLRDRRRSS